MEIVSTKIPEVKIITPKKFGDHRGFFSETYNANTFNEAGLDLNFVQDNHSLSGKKGTIRGLHFQSHPFAQDKLVRVTRGSIIDVAVDIRKGSPTYGQYVAEELSAENWKQLLVPVGFAHGFCTLEDDTEVMYKVTGFYSQANDFGVRWDDPEIGIDWPLDGVEPQLSDKDKVQPLLKDLPEYFTYEGA